MTIYKPQKLLIDTHFLLWHAFGNASITSFFQGKIEEAAERNQLFVSSISALEISRLVFVKRLDLEEETTLWFKKSLKKIGAKIIPVTTDIAIESYALPGDLHKDPADRIIVATARLENAILATMDGLILQYAEEGHFQVLKPQREEG
jgi:PIN domain nuclease of toxin-antitoxin system